MSQAKDVAYKLISNHWPHVDLKGRRHKQGKTVHPCREPTQHAASSTTLHSGSPGPATEEVRGMPEKAVELPGIHRRSAAGCMSTVHHPILHTRCQFSIHVVLENISDIYTESLSNIWYVVYYKYSSLRLT